MHIEIPDELYGKYLDLLKHRFASENVSYHVQSLVETELRRFAAPGYDVDNLTRCKTWYQLERDINRFTHGFDWQNHDPIEKVYLCVNIHNLKNYNDTRGLYAGDQVLVQVAEMLRSAYAENTLYRVGGDRFVIDSPAKILEVHPPAEVSLKFSVIQVMAKRNQGKQGFVDKAIMFHIEEGLVKATTKGIKLIYDYSSM